MVNPNDPEAFNFLTQEEAQARGVSDNKNNNDSDPRDDAAIKDSSNRNSLLGGRRRRRSSHGSLTPENASERSNNSNHKSMSSFSSSSHHGRTSGSHSSHDFSNQKTTTIPKFGEWDEKDPQSGESYTIIFRKLKEEKQTQSHHFPNVPSQLNSSDMQKNSEGHSSGLLSKYCCCLFSSESK
ncbi:RPM1-interacting protein 4-like [Senna tora]|uniref:RPM1-interacting protein 4-like n=1 Tax=Senna tora TaxID=362788 RepID=A0A834XAM5_9FABA|nr:RPM1-interacting protein 4-like [Senna tora]